MIEAPEVRYVRNGDMSLAYQVVGDGPIDLIEVPGLFTHLEVKWESPGLVRFIETLARFARAKATGLYVPNCDLDGDGEVDERDAARAGLFLDLPPGPSEVAAARSAAASAGP